MAVQATLVLNSKNYLPSGKENGVATWGLRGDTTFGGAYSAATQSLRGPSKDGLYRIRFKLDVPLAASADSACGCAGQIKANGVGDFQIVVPATYSAAERLDFCERLQSFVASAVFQSAVADLEGAW